MASWGYGPSNGPSTWSKNYPIAEGPRQSPINIKTSEAKYDADLPDRPLNISYTPENELYLKNSGKSIVCEITKNSELSGGPLGGKFKLAQFHLHWGSEDSKGSEHTINGKEYAAELHLVHYNTKYASFGEAVNKNDGLAVLGIMIQAGTENKEFKKITDNIPGVISSGSESKQRVSLDPAQLLPSNIAKYWTYEGSLTTPPLFESVRWIVFQTPVDYSHDQLEKLRSLVNSDRDKMQNNYRPPVDIKGREVRASFK